LARPCGRSDFDGVQNPDLARREGGTRRRLPRDL
jgi:hypothetical protein